MIIWNVETSKVPHVLKDWLLQSTSLSENASEKKLTLDLNITTEMKWRMYAFPSNNRHTLLSKQLQYKNSSRKDESE